jgi:DNA repair protein RadC
MSFTARELKQLQQIVGIGNILIAKAEEQIEAKSQAKAEKEANKRVRRSGKELIKFRRDLKKMRNDGVPVAELAETYGVSASYIYQL